MHEAHQTQTHELLTSGSGLLAISSRRPIHPAAQDDADLLTNCHVRRQRRSGPGGQHRNKVETAVVFVHRPTGVTGAASERRNQEQNRRRALFRLRVNLALRVRLPADAGPSSAWRTRCRDGRIRVSVTHNVFPQLLAEALDVLHECGMEVTKAARRLGCTSSQLVKLLQRETRALQQVNQCRDRLGLARLR